MSLSRRTVLGGLAATGALALSPVAAHAATTRATVAASVEARRTIALRGRPAAEAERLRMQTVYRTTDFVPTGFYLAPGTPLTLEVRGTARPTLYVGAADTNPDRTYRYPRAYPLTAGRSTVTDPGGGPVYLALTGGVADRAVVRIGDSAVPSPTFVAGLPGWERSAPSWGERATTEAAFQQQVDTLTGSPFVELISPQMILTIRRETFLQVRDQDHHLLMDLLEQVEDQEAAISGLDGSSPLHAPTPLGRHLINVLPGYGPVSTAYATHAYTAYYDPYTTTRLLVPEKIRTSGWGVYHEFGHQHQQMAWRPGELTEVTVNIYSLAAQRYFGMPSNLVVNNAYQTAFAKFPITSYAGLTAFEKLVPFRQLELAYGDDFYPRVHRLVREEQTPPGASGDSGRRFSNLAVLFSRVAGHDLTGFLRAWAMPVPESGYAEVAALGLPQPAVDLARLSE
ncbi:M60 family metallopeptidase [Nonomuraea sp. NPDC050310]|uniref:M60 family metallopeptidase n=1 Tax=Nonomuraea sp. NPDC050310 TaxID=3154935 RepID=UPI0033DC6917